MIRIICHGIIDRNDVFIWKIRYLKPEMKLARIDHFSGCGVEESQMK